MLVSRLSLIILAAIALPPVAAAASATADPASAEPGARVILVYTEDASTVDLRALAAVTCTIEGPEPIECGSANEVVVARLPGTPRTYAFEIVAPATLGGYTARFEQSALLAPVAPASPAAEATFFVVSPPVGPDPTTPSSIVPGSIDIAGGEPPAPGAGRWLLNLFMATGATTAAVVVARRPGGL